MINDIDATEEIKPRNLYEEFTEKKKAVHPVDDNYSKEDLNQSFLSQTPSDNGNVIQIPNFTEINESPSKNLIFNRREK